MKRRVTLNDIYAVSGDAMVRKVKGKTILIPPASIMKDGQNELYTLNPTGEAVWQRLDGKRRLKDVAAQLADKFNSPPGEIEKDVVGIVKKLLKNGMLVEISGH